mmetsp:Transcript_27405/g.56301  ORF Transcript_27405/g.56301 Transcript_27405/m.56301 type:complete len:869 (-) Transcript_27405:106-2712(-)
MMTRTMSRERRSSFAEMPSSPTSPYSLSKENMREMSLSNEFESEDADDQVSLTTAGKSYQELIETQYSQTSAYDLNDSLDNGAKEAENDYEKYDHRRSSVGFFLGGGRTSIAPAGNSKTRNFRDSSEIGSIQQNPPGSADIRDTSFVNLSARGSFVNDRQRSGQRRGRANCRSKIGSRSLPSPKSPKSRRSTLTNLSHISSSSSSSESILGDSWSPIQMSLDRSFGEVAEGEKRKSNGEGFISPKSGRGPMESMSKPNCSASLSSMSGKKGRSLSPIKTNENFPMGKNASRNADLSESLSPMKSIKSPIKGQLKSPKRSQSKSPVRSPVRSPLADISPNRTQKSSLSPPRSNNGDTTTNARGLLSPKQRQSRDDSIVECSPKEKPAGQLQTTEKSAFVGGTITGNNGTFVCNEFKGKQNERKGYSLPANHVKDAHLESVTSPTPQRNCPHSFAEKNSEGTEGSLSPEFRSPLLARNPPRNHSIRSPAPTPNSQRRVVKRFRASIPSAKYLSMEDTMDSPEDKESNVGTKGIDTVLKDQPVSSNQEILTVEEQPEEQDAPKMPQIEFDFPHSIPRPGTKTFRVFHDIACAKGSISHQYQLNRAGTNLLSLQEVILPSIAFETSSVLKQQQSKAQRKLQDGMPDHQGADVVDAIETCRRVVKKCTESAVKASGQSWRERERKRQEELTSCREKEEEQKKRAEEAAKKERKEQRAISRKLKCERAKREKMKNHPRNKAMWQEVARLMTDIQKLEKEERMWKDASVEVDSMEKNFCTPEKMDLNSLESEKDMSSSLDIDNSKLEATATTLVQDVTLATERINWMLKRVSLAMEESDGLRKEAFDKYQKEHKFHGYPKYDDPKGLFMALSMDD